MLAGEGVGVLRGGDQSLLGYGWVEGGGVLQRNEGYHKDMQDTLSRISGSLKGSKNSSPVGEHRRFSSVLLQ